MTSGREEEGVLKTGLPLRLVSRTDVDRAAEGQPGRLPAGGGTSGPSSSSSSAGRVMAAAAVGRQGLGANRELANLPGF